LGSPPRVHDLEEFEESPCITYTSLKISLHNSTIPFMSRLQNKLEVTFRKLH